MSTAIQLGAPAKSGTLRAGRLPRQLLATLGLEGVLLGGAGALAGAALSLSVSLMLYVVEVRMPAPGAALVGYPLYVSIDATLHLGELFTSRVARPTMAAASAWVAPQDRAHAHYQCPGADLGKPPCITP